MEKRSLELELLWLVEFWGEIEWGLLGAEKKSLEVL